MAKGRLHVRGTICLLLLLCSLLSVSGQAENTPSTHGSSFGLSSSVSPSSSSTRSPPPPPDWQAHSASTTSSPWTSSSWPHGSSTPEMASEPDETTSTPTTIANLFQGCDGIADLTQTPGQIRSPNYPDDYDPDSTCLYQIEVPDGKIVKVHFDDLDLEQEDYPSTCKYDYIAIYEGGDASGTELAKVCSNMTYDTVWSKTNRVFIKFVSDHSHEARGFQLTYTAEDPNGNCPEVIALSVTDTSGWLIEKDYDNNLNCSWTLEVAHGLGTKLEFYEFELEKDPFDVLVVTNSTGASKRMSGTNLPLPFNSSDHRLFLNLQTDNSLTKSGFRARYTAINEHVVCGEPKFGDNGTISHPGNGAVLPNRNCEWTITTSPGTHVVVTFLDFAIEDSEDCQAGFVEIRDGGYLESPLLWKNCGHLSAVPNIVSHTNQVYIRLVTDADHDHEGFDLVYYAQQGCGGVLTAPEGIIQSPNYPKNISDNQHCTWSFMFPPNFGLVRLTTLDMDIGTTGPNYDYYIRELRCFEGAYVQTVDPNIGFIFQTLSSRFVPNPKNCGTELMPVAEVNATNQVVFSSTNGTVGRGFQFMYEMVCGAHVENIPTGTIASPYFPDMYGSESECIWMVTNTEELVYHTITFVQLNLPDCETQFVKILDLDGVEQGHYCGEQTPPALHLMSSGFKVLYMSGATSQGQGFRLEWSSSGCWNYSRDPQGTLTSLWYPQPMTPEIFPLWCGWNFFLDDGDALVLNFTDISWEDCENSPITVSKHYDTVNVCKENSVIVVPERSYRQWPSIEWNYNLTNNQPVANPAVSFAVTYRIGCSYNITINPGSGDHFLSPGYSYYYEPKTCTWILKGANASTEIYLDVFWFDIGGSYYDNNNCSTGALRITTSSEPNIEHVFCNNNLPNRTWQGFHGNEINVTLAVLEGSSWWGGFDAIYRAEAIDCGRTFMLEEWTYSTLQSPGYGFLGNYTTPRNCTWTLKSTNASFVVNLNLYDLDIGHDSSDCSQGSLTIRTQRGENHARYVLCGDDTPSRTYYGDVVNVTFDVRHGSHGAGFQAHYFTGEVPCEQTITQGNGTIKSPNYPANYPSNKTCTWNLNAPLFSRVSLNFTDVSIAGYYSSCYDDYVTVYDKVRMNYTTFCDWNLSSPRNFTSTVGGGLEVTFHSDLSNVSRGFKANYSMDYVCGANLTGESGAFGLTEPLTTAGDNLTCTWAIEVASGMAIHLDITNLEGEMAGCYPSLRVFSMDETMTPEICGQQPRAYVTRGNKLWVQYHYTDALTSRFSAAYQQIDPSQSCGGEMSTSVGEIRESPGPGVCPPGQPLVWSATGDEDLKVRLDFGRGIYWKRDMSYLSTTPLWSGLVKRQAAATSCEAGEITVYDGLSLSSPVLYHHCEEGDYTWVPRLTSSSNELLFTITPGPGRVADFMTKMAEVCFVNITEYPVNIVSPNFPDPYDTPYECTYVFTNENEYRRYQSFHLTVHHFELAPAVDMTSGCDGPDSMVDRVEVSEVLERGEQWLMAFCDSNRPLENYEFPAYHVGSFALRFVANAHSNSATGFNVTISEDCQMGDYRAYWFPSSRYLTRTDVPCFLTITSGRASHGVSLSFLYTGLPSDCSRNYIEIHEGGNVTRFCYDELPTFITPFRSQGMNLTLVFLGQDLRGEVECEFVEYIIPNCTLLTDPTGTLNSPNYPSLYPNNLETCWHIRAAAGQRVSITFTDFSLEGPPDCPFDYVQLYNGDDMDSSLLAELCDDMTTPMTYTSSGEDMLVRMKTDGSVIRSGFSATYTTFTGSTSSTSWPTPSTSSSSSSPSTSQSPWTPSTTYPSISTSSSENCEVYTNQSGVVQSPNHPSHYENNLEMCWLVSVAEGQVISLTFTDFSVERHSSCRFDVVKVFDGDTMESSQLSDDPGLCDGRAPPIEIPYISTGNHVLVYFYTDGSVTRSGFSAVYEAHVPGEGPTLPTSNTENCEVYTSQSGVVQSPNYPSHYDNNLEMCWLVSVAEGQVISLTFTDFSVESQTYCRYDVVKVFDGDTMESSQLSDAPGLCDGRAPPIEIPYISTGNHVLVYFKTDFSVTQGGFSAVYEAFEEGDLAPTSPLPEV